MTLRLCACTRCVGRFLDLHVFHEAYLNLPDVDRCVCVSLSHSLTAVHAPPRRHVMCACGLGVCAALITRRIWTCLRPCNRCPARLGHPRCVPPYVAAALSRLLFPCSWPLQAYRQYAQDLTRYLLSFVSRSQPLVVRPRPCVLHALLHSCPECVIVHVGAVGAGLDGHHQVCAHGVRWVPPVIRRRQWHQRCAVGQRCFSWCTGGARC